IERISKTFDDEAIHTQLASLLVRMGAWRQAIAEYDWIDRRSSWQAEVAIVEGLKTAAASSEFRELLLNFFRRRDRLNSAVELFQRLSRTHPDNPYLRIGLIEAQTLAGAMDLVRQELRGLSRQFSVDSAARLDLGRFFLASNYEDLALSQYLRAYRGGLEDSEVALSLAGLQGRAGAYTDAIRTASRVQRQAIWPARVRSAAALLAGTSSMSAGKEQEAIEYLQQAIKLGPDMEANYLALSQVYEVLREPGKALEVLEIGAAQIVPSPNYLLSLARAFLANDEYEAAVSVLVGLVEHHPEQVDAYLPLARAYHLTNQSEREIRTMRRLAELRPDYPMLPITLAQSLMDAGPSGYTQALEELQRAEEATPLDADIFSLRSRLLQLMGHLDEAEMQLRHAVELRPTDPAFRYQLALLYQRLGKEDLALEQIEKKNHLERALIPDLTEAN
ncbi:MAG TPA: tetratricopeptide repeat protein, partial [Anaerolineales bacterium]